MLCDKELGLLLIVYSQGDRVYYIKPPEKRWRGPGVVMGHNGSTVLVQHGGLSYRVHRCRLMKVSDSEPYRGDVDNNISLIINIMKLIFLMRMTQ